jgi:predicted glutamine amidotransferase
MCRMIGVVSRAPVPCGQFLDELVKQSRYGMEAEHGDGYGVALFTGGHWLHVREQCPVWEGALDGLREVLATIMILHSRKASDRTTIELTKLHPFAWPGRPPGVMFCQNGTIRHHERLRTRAPGSAIDTEKYFDLVIQQLETGAPLDSSVAAAAREIDEAGADPTSLNAMLSDGKELVAYKGRILPENEEYHTLWTADAADASVVTTERFDWGGAAWSPLEGTWTRRYA